MVPYPSVEIPLFHWYPASYTLLGIPVMSLGLSDNPYFFSEAAQVADHLDIPPAFLMSPGTQPGGRGEGTGTQFQ